MTGEIQKNLEVKLFRWFQISVEGFDRIFVCCCFCCLAVKDMAEEALGTHRRTRHVYIRHVSVVEREILDILQNFEPEKEESVTVLESLRDGLTDKLVKIKAIDDSVLALLDQNESEKELDDIIARDDKLRLTLRKLERNLQKVNIGSSSVHSSSISNGNNQTNVKFASQNLPSKRSTGMSQISLAFGSSMTLLFTKNKILVTLISSCICFHISYISFHICVIQKIL